MRWREYTRLGVIPGSPINHEKDAEARRCQFGIGELLEIPCHKILPAELESMHTARERFLLATSGLKAANLGRDG